MHGIVLSCMRSNLKKVNLPNILWGEAFAFEVEILNIRPSNALKGRHVLDDSRNDQISRNYNKLENPGKPYIFVGYGKNSLSYRVLDLKTGITKKLRTVEFAEDWTVEYSYVKQLVLNRYKRGNYKVPSQILYKVMIIVTSDIVVMT
ncbi:LOW QUALITY PROTEIN: polyprotein [Phytophthora palmivora]|uniref:Polyprotein n=1 Tax=Phytophthora palmivora TaxID=4796 RepID=A0A2P4X0W7_9STRA|nr:LOW QUALITY PROTEIN: polyprotein [Phytophthora palmivora]